MDSDAWGNGNFVSNSVRLQGCSSISVSVNHSLPRDCTKPAHKADVGCEVASSGSGQGSSQARR